MSELTTKHPVHVVVDKNGRQFVGRVVNKNEASMELLNPLLMIERITPTQVADKAEIMLNFSPVLNTFPVDGIEVKWVNQFPVDENLERAYEDFWVKIRAARSGLSVVQTIPRQGVARN